MLSQPDAGGTDQARLLVAVHGEQAIGPRGPLLDLDERQDIAFLGNDVQLSPAQAHVARQELVAAALKKARRPCLCGLTGLGAQMWPAAMP